MRALPLFLILAVNECFSQNPNAEKNFVKMPELLKKSKTDPTIYEYSNSFGTISLQLKTDSSFLYSSLAEYDYKLSIGKYYIVKDKITLKWDSTQTFIGIKNIKTYNAQKPTGFIIDNVSYYFENNLNTIEKEPLENYKAKIVGLILPTDTTHKRSRTYASYKFNLGVLNASNSPGDLVISFPYTTIVKNGGVAISSNYYQKIPNVFPKNFTLCDVLHFTLGHNSLFYDIGFGGLIKTGSASPNFNAGAGFMLNAGFGYSLPFGKNERVNKKEKQFFLNSSLNFFYNSFSVDMDNGNTIDNEGKQIDVLGLTAAPTYTWNSRSSGGFHEVNASKLGLSLSEQCLSLSPKICITNNPYTHKFHFGAYISYFIPLARFESLGFYQTNDSINHGHHVGSVPIKTNSINVTYNNTTVSKIPLNFGGLYFGVTIGYNFYHSKKKR